MGQRIQVMQEETVKHSAAVQSSTHAATLALAESRHASEAAKAAKDSACEVSLYTHRIRDMEQQLKKALREMDKLDDDLKNQRRENQTLKNRLQDLEKKIQTH
jgi:predicted RNase H-like nuclease (RuvC/YqgF family)